MHGLREERSLQRGAPKLRRALVVVAHPDDEAIFFFSTIRRLRREGFLVDVLCATGIFGEEAATTKRMAEFQESCRRLGVRGQSLGLADARGRSLCMEELRIGIRNFCSDYFNCVYTHGPWGDYGHLHHVCCCQAVYEYFGDKAYSLAGPLPPIRTIQLSEAEYQAKLEHMEGCYPSQRFAWTWCTKRESFAQFRTLEALTLASIALGDNLPLTPSEGSGFSPTLVLDYLLGYAELSAYIPAEIEQIPEKVWRHTFSGFCIKLRDALVESAEL